jgi:hypothetical protein
MWNDSSTSGALKENREASGGGAIGKHSIAEFFRTLSVLRKPTTFGGGQNHLQFTYCMRP